MDKMKWCLKKVKGVKLVKPNENLSRSYVKKAENSLISMRLNFKAGINEWAASAAYYARYHILYALLMKCGIKSEIHECSIAAVKNLFSESISQSLVKELESAKVQRINMQYYTDRQVEESKLRKNIETAGDFVLQLKSITDKITEERIEMIRRKIRELINSKA